MRCWERPGVPQIVRAAAKELFGEAPAGAGEWFSNAAVELPHNESLATS